MTEERTISFLAYVCKVGVANITLEEKSQLDKLALRYVKVTDSVRRRDNATGVPYFEGVLESMNNNMAKVKLSAPMEMQTAAGPIALISNLTVPLEQIEKIPPLV